MPVVLCRYIFWFDARESRIMYYIYEKPIPRTRSRSIIVLSRIGSFIFHPLVMTSLSGLSLRYLAEGKFSARELFMIQQWFSWLLLFTIGLPLLSIFLLKALGLISNAFMHSKSDRIWPLFLSAIFYFLAYRKIATSYNNSLLGILVLGSFLAITVVFFVNLFYKISVHTTAAGILPGLYLALMIDQRITDLLPLAIALSVAGLVGVMRWVLGAHTRGQLIFGYAVGIFSQVGVYFYTNT